MQAPLTNVKRTWTRPAQLESLHGRPAAEEPTCRAHEPSAAMERFLCEVCGDVIGVYEPLVMRTVDDERATSRAAEPELRASDGAYFHRECRDATAG